MFTGDDDVGGNWVRLVRCHWVVL